MGRRGGIQIINAKLMSLRALISAVVEAQYYKPEEHGFETRRSESLLSIYIFLTSELGPWIYSFSN